MANYVLYHPKGFPNNSNPEEVIHSNSYCTDVMMSSIKDALEVLGHSVRIEYIHIIPSHPDNLNEYLIDFSIPEIELDVTLAPTTLWFILANSDTKKFVAVDLQDSPAFVASLKNHKNLIFSMVGQFSLERYRYPDLQFDITKMIPFVYCAYYPVHTREMREEIQEIRRSMEKLDDRLFFYGNNRDTYIHADRDGEPQKIREVISVLAEKYPDETCVGSWEAKLPLDDWFRKAATHTINLALPGHQWCSREHELWTLGLPVMMYEHTHAQAINLIPNYHYIASPGGDRLNIGMAKDPECAADNLIRTHREWIKPENRWRLNLIAQHGQERMDNYASPEVVGRTILPLLEIGHW